jgi:hypothetical protein
MSSRDRQKEAAHEFDRTLRAVLRDSVRGEEPSPRVREALLRAAMDDRRRAVESSIDEYLAGGTRPAQSEIRRAWDASGDPMTIGVLQAHLLRVRFVV